MQKLYYDFHIHSCLSPCGDNDMTPCNIVNMATLKGLDVICLTDHNSTKNTPAIYAAAKVLNPSLILLAGMELCTEEEVHMLCLFDSPDKALLFEQYVSACMIDFMNNEQKFGEQNILNGEDRLIGKEPRLLINATVIALDELPGLMREYDGVAVPAHVDRQSYSVLSVLGMLPPELGANAIEVKDPNELPSLAQFGLPGNKLVLHNSDAHYLWDINEKDHFIEVEEASPMGVIAVLRAGVR